MADGASPLDEQIARAEQVAADLPDLHRAEAAADRELAAAEQARDQAQAGWDGAHEAARSARLPRLHAWGALLSLRLRSTRETAQAAEEAAAGAVADARRLVDRRRAEQRAARARTATALATAGSLPGLRQLRRLEQLRRADDPLARQVDEIDDDLRRSDERLRQLDEADAALARAAEAVRAASATLDSARSWGTYDTFFGGDLLSSMVKHDRVDESNRDLRRAGDAIDAARRELADVSIDLVADPLEVGPLLRTTDVWFDNLVSDLAVQGRIVDHVRSIERLRDRLGRLRARVGAELHAAQQERQALVRRRSELLTR